MKTIDRFLNRIPLIHKILVILVVCVIIPFSFQMYLYFSETEKNIQVEIYQKMDDVLTETANKIEASILDTLNVVAKYGYDIRLYQCMDRIYANDIDYLVEYQENVQQFVSSDLPLHLQLDSISFYTDNPTIFNGFLVQQVLPYDSDQLGGPILEQAIYSIKGQNSLVDFRVGLRTQRPEKASRRTVAVLRELSYYPQYQTYTKAMKVELNTTYYNTLLSKTALFDNLLLVDPGGRVLFCANTYSQSGEFDCFDEGKIEKNVIVLKREINGLPMTLYGYYGTNMITDQFIKSIPSTVMMLLSSIVLSALLILLIGQNLSRRTRAIIEKSKQIAKGDFVADNVAQILSAGDDEIAQIEKGINIMSMQLKDYIEREYAAKLIQSRLEQENTQAKLMALQSQVNPHFMFNALESIRLNALESDKRETVRMIKHMSKMFRYLVDWDGDIIRLQRELDFLDEYLSIQKYRFGDDFSYSIHVDEAAKACLVPKLILQPLVENACLHGVEATSNDKDIRIDVQIEAGTVHLKVEDNGGGITPERLAQFREMLCGGTQAVHSVGLYNVYQRLKLYYTKAFAFEIDSVVGRGTICTVTVPLRYEDLADITTHGDDQGV